jgi:hypothetical protein
VVCIATYFARYQLDIYKAVIIQTPMIRPENKTLSATDLSGNIMKLVKTKCKKQKNQ